MVSFISRIPRSTELRIEKVELYDAARQFIEEAFLLHARDMTGQIPHVYFGWTEGTLIW